MIPASDLAGLPLEAASTIGGGSRRLVLGATRSVIRRVIEVAFGPPGPTRTERPAKLAIFSTNRDA